MGESFLDLSAEKLMRRALWSAVGSKLAGETARGVGVSTMKLAEAAYALGKLSCSYADTLLMLECHYGRRYSDLTSRDLGFAVGQPARHAMNTEELPEQGGVELD